MKVVAFDFETHTFRPGCMAPKPVCMTYASQGEPPAILLREHCKPQIERWLRDPSVLLLGHNLAYDAAVAMAEWPDLIPLWFDAYEADRVCDTMTRQHLLDIADGRYGGKQRYGLDACVLRHHGVFLDKSGDTWRKRYAELDGVPLGQWPKAALAYALDDAKWTLKVGQAQSPRRELLGDQFRQARGALWSHLSSVHGIRTRKEAVDELEHMIQSERSSLYQGVVAAGFVWKDGTKNTKAIQQAVIKAYGRMGAPVPVTPKGNVIIDAEVCAESGDEALVNLGLWASKGSLLNKDVPMFRRGEVYPIHTSYGMAETGRYTSRAPNLQNLGALRGVRECFAPRDGFVFAQADFSGLELHTWSQVCLELFGQSRLSEVLNAGDDAHSMMAATILRRPYAEVLALKEKDEVVGRARTLAKICNFGLMGGSGWLRIQTEAHSLGIELSEAEAKGVREDWKKTWPEAQKYLDWVNYKLEESGKTVLRKNKKTGKIEEIPVAAFEQISVGRTRGDCAYTQGANTMFQGLGADAMKQAGWEITRECYVDRNTALFGCRIAAQVHDEVLMEVPEETAHEAAFRMADRMVYGASKLLPKCPARTSKPALMKVWSKKAKAVFGSDGRLIPWAA